VDLADLPVVDGHCHPLLPEPWAISAARFLDLFSEGRPGTMAPHVPHTGYHRRALRALAERLGCEPTVESVLARRRALGGESARQLLAKARVATLLVDTGYPPRAMPLTEMRTLLPCAIHEIFRIETCAETLLAQSLPFDAFLDAFREGVRGATRRCVALKTIIAYRSGLSVRHWDADHVQRVYGDARTRLAATGSPRLTDKPLLDTLLFEALEIARETGRPLQIHTGLGDPDIDLLQANPLLLRPLLEDSRWDGARVVLLHMAYPYAREAAFMAAVWPHVYVDLSLAPAYLGPGSVAPLLQLLSLAPASKLLYGSDLGALPELLALAADWTRAALADALGWLVDRAGLTADEARDAARRILADNAVGLYGVPPP
jgi:hypothetical protein